MLRGIRYSINWCDVEETLQSLLLVNPFYTRIFLKKSSIFQHILDKLDSWGQIPWAKYLISYIGIFTSRNSTHIITRVYLFLTLNQILFQMHFLFGVIKINQKKTKLIGCKVEDTLRRHEQSNTISSQSVFKEVQIKMVDHEE